MSTYRITEFGVRPDGKTINTEKIQKAIDTCYKNGGGRIIFQPGIYKTGTIFLKSNVELYLENGSKIIGSESLNDYKELDAEGFIMEKIEPKKEITKNALIIAVDSENLGITGSGEINGSGLSFYKDYYKKPEIPRPRIVMFYNCKNVFFEGISFVNSACWTIWLMKCENINIHKVKIYGDRRMRNIDGIDVDSCKNVVISDCIMDTQDDCIAVRCIKQFYKEEVSCENITVSNCILKTDCNGIRIECPSDGEIKNCVFKNLIIEGTRGIIFQFPKVYLLENSKGCANVHDILFSNVIIESKLNPIWITVEEGIKLERISDINFSNIKIIKSGGPLTIEGNSEIEIHNISFNNLEMENFSDNSIICRNCKNILFNNVKLNNSQKK
ncbi:MAG: glycosyl hydrolase family 28 protein [Candidatus Omnitrophica bacterium]|nr:glycosyl hydrolase family 28 protein [Candidatus Omnitrophota bacterium]